MRNEEEEGTDAKPRAISGLLEYGRGAKEEAEGNRMGNSSFLIPHFSLFTADIFSDSGHRPHAGGSSPSVQPADEHPSTYRPSYWRMEAR